MIKIYLDIETIPTQREDFVQNIQDNIKPPGSIKKAESIQKWMTDNGEAAAQEQIHKTSLNGGMGQVFCIGLAIGVEEPNVLIANSTQFEDEATILNVFNDAMEKAIKNSLMHYKIIGHNVFDFDLKFLFHRMVVHGIEPKFANPFNNGQYDKQYYDTMKAWAGYRDYVSLDNLCKYLNIPTPKDGIDGSKVWDYVLRGKVKEVAEYCKQDVIAVREVEKRLIFSKC
jgi:predicted PolB exonuclease-like 3'-5' exonuclease